MDGFFNVNKPAGLTSHDVVYRMRRWSGERQVGHAGTLDPDATGVLPLGLGYGTRLLEFWPEPKVYVARIEFGIETDSYDAAGQVVATMDTSCITPERIGAALPLFEGETSQRPPRFSAVKHQGQRMYQLARQVVVVEP
ncbi:MAG: tRNA pseudouridine(55) synthase TruB, partial [Chloroflexota bacterium]